MKNWDYEELIDSTQEEFSDHLQDGLFPNQAVECSLVELRNALLDGYCEKIIVYAVLGTLIAQYSNKITKGQYSKLMDVLNTFDHANASRSLLASELDDLTKRIQTAKVALNGMEKV
jgi:hypothetical protein